MENKKIKNASKHTYNDIEFKSSLEVTVYKTLLQEGFNPKYEPETFIVWEGFKPTTPYYTRNRGKLKLNSIVVRDITYTPDFIVKYGDKTIVIEVKGFCNDVFPIKRKMFRKYIEGKSGFMYFEIYSKRELLEAIKIIRNE